MLLAQFAALLFAQPFELTRIDWPIDAIVRFVGFVVEITIGIDFRVSDWL